MHCLDICYRRVGGNVVPAALLLVKHVGVDVNSRRYDDAIKQMLLARPCAITAGYSSLDVHTVWKQGHDLGQT